MARPGGITPVRVQSIADDEPDAAEHPWLKIESGSKRGLVEAAEAVRIRDGLRRVGGETAEQLATIIDAKATELLAAPDYAGTVSIRMDAEEAQCLLALLTKWSTAGEITNTGDDHIWRLWNELAAPSR
jgi:hypothetical protein